MLLLDAPAAAALAGGRARRQGVANLADRAADGKATDLLSVGWWPTFKLADTLLVIGVLRIAVHTWRADARRAGTVPTEERA